MKPEAAGDGADEVRRLLALLLLPGLGPVRIGRLLSRFGDSATSLEALRRGRATLRGEAPLQAAVQEALRSAAFQRRVDAAVGVLERDEVAVLRRADPRLPDTLWQLPEPPIALFARGRLDLLGEDRVRISVVGTRRPTEYGRDAGWHFAEGLAMRGAVVVSGLARGIDGIAHEAALEAGGGTIAVLGCGPDVAYPREHARLQSRIARDGLVLTEYPPGVGPRKHHFRLRNRLIAGVSRGVLMVEGGHGSGALITAHVGMDLSLHVFGVPGPVGRPSSEGVNALIRDGAHLAMDPAWVAETCGLRGVGNPGGGAAAAAHESPVAAAGAPMQLSGDAGRVLAVLGPDALHVDEIAGAVGLAAGGVLAALLDLEVRGLVRRFPG